MDRVAQLEAFVRIVEVGSLSAAARQLGSSLPAVSRHLAALEQQLGVTLAQRTTRRLRITPEGQRYYQHCVRVLQALAEADASVTSGPALAGQLRVSLPLTFGLGRIVPLLPPFLARHPRLQVDLMLEDRVVELVGEGVDLAVRTGFLRAPDSAALISRPLGGDRLQLCASPGYLRAHGEPSEPQQLAGHALVGFLSQKRVRAWRVVNGARAVEVGVDGRLWVGDALTVLALVRDGVGYSALPDWLIADDVARGTLRVLLPGWELPQSRVFALYRREARRTAAIRALLEHLAEGLAAPRTA